MAVLRTTFRLLLMIMTTALIPPMYFAVWRFIEVDPIPRDNLRPGSLLLSKKTVGRFPDLRLPDADESDSSNPSIDVFNKEMRVNQNFDSRLSEMRFETDKSQSHSLRDRSFKTVHDSHYTDIRPSKPPPKSPVDALEDKYKNEIYRQSCKYLMIWKGLHRVCIDRYSNGSRGRPTAKAVMTQKEYFTEKPVLRPAIGNASIMKAVDTQKETSFDGGIRKSEQLKMNKTPVKHYRHRGVVASALPNSKPSMRGIMYYTPWVSYVDPHDYRYLVNPSLTTCMEHDRVDLLILVTSHPQHTQRRDVIRETWGNSRGNTAMSPVVEVRFLLGVTTLGGRTLLASDLQVEVDKHGDLIVEEFLESYLNLSIKTVMGLKWASRFCPDARFVMKTDDDIIVNTPRLLMYLHTAPWRALITGHLAKSYPVLRDRWEKFYVPNEVYSKSTYPDYCVGLGYVMSMDLVHRLYHQSLFTPLFPWEDVYVGIMLKDIGIIPKGINNFYYFSGGSLFTGKTIVVPKKTLYRLRSYYVLDGLTPNQTRILWKQMAVTAATNDADLPGTNRYM